VTRWLLKILSSYAAFHKAPIVVSFLVVQSSTSANRSILLDSGGRPIGLVVFDAMHDAAFDSNVDGALRVLLTGDPAVGTEGKGVSSTVMLLPCVAEADRSSGAGNDSSRIVGLLVIGMLCPRGPTQELAPHHLYIADVISAACTAGILRVTALAQSRHLEAAAADAVKRAHRQVQETEIQVGTRAAM
jgi:hypothetical protein